MKVPNAIMKWFLKATSSHMNGFPKAAKGDNFCRFLNTVCSCCKKTTHVAISDFHQPFHFSSSGFLNAFAPTRFELENINYFQ
jgi:hypothetical protein